MAEQTNNLIEEERFSDEPGSRWRSRIIGAVIIILIVAGIGFLVTRGEEEVTDLAEVRKQVTVRPYNDLVADSEVRKIAALEPAVNVPLISRVGGRVTAINANLGSEVTSATTVIEVDGTGVASPVRAQASSAAAALAAFDNSRRAALASADNSVALAQLGLDAAKAGKVLTGEQVAKGREQADLAVKQAEFTLADILDSDSRTDELERSAHIALEAAQLAQDQATVSKNIAGRQTSDGFKQAEKNLLASEVSKQKLAADLDGQRASLAGQATAAREQLRLAQVITPVAGQVTRLAVREGEFIQPGQIVGEVTAFEGARVTLMVESGVRSKLSLGQVIPIEYEAITFTGEIVGMATGPSASTALWQIDVFISSTPEIIHPGELVTVTLPVAPGTGSSVFIPLDVLTVRQDGVVVFVVDDSGLVSEHQIQVVRYMSDFAEALLIDLHADAQIVIEGNRTLQAGDTVEAITL